MSRKLISKERVKTAFAHQEPDRVPRNYMANSGIDLKLKKYFKLAADDTEGLLEILGIDFREVFVPYTGPGLFAGMPERRTDIWGAQTRWIEYGNGNGYWDYCDFPLKGAAPEEIHKWPLPSPDDFDYSQVKIQCRKWKNYFLFYGNPGLADVMNNTGFLFSMEDVLIGLVSGNPELLWYMKQREKIELEVMDRVLETANGAIDMIWIGEDLGTQEGPLINPELYRKYLKPHHKKYADLAKTYGIPVMQHSCGSSSWAFEDLLEIGITAVDTLQPEAKNMEPQYLKNKYGGRLSFHGCISTAGAVANGTAAETAEDVKKILNIMKPGGGFALSPTHLLQDNSPLLNVLALYEAAEKFGYY
ncbi:MAG: hypothetical protein GXP33_00315 [Spirochaetes bacterium]|nr:hypothetical protein [Spirochaetota bacterium]